MKLNHHSLWWWVYIEDCGLKTCRLRKKKHKRAKYQGTYNSFVQHLHVTGFSAVLSAILPTQGVQRICRGLYSGADLGKCWGPFRGSYFWSEGRETGSISSLKGCCVTTQRSGQVSQTWKVLVLLPTAVASSPPCHSGSGFVTRGVWAPGSSWCPFN